VGERIWAFSLQQLLGEEDGKGRLGGGGKKKKIEKGGPHNLVFSRHSVLELALIFWHSRNGRNLRNQRKKKKKKKKKTKKKQAPQLRPAPMCEKYQK